jgi:putative transposase
VIDLLGFMKMKTKRHTSEEIIAKLLRVEALTSHGGSVAEAVRSIGVTEVTYYRWRQEYGVLKCGQVKRLKELELENTRLRQAVSDLILEKQILKEAALETLNGAPRSTDLAQRSVPSPTCRGAGA